MSPKKKSVILDSLGYLSTTVHQSESQSLMFLELLYVFIIIYWKAFPDIIVDPDILRGILNKGS